MRLVQLSPDERRKLRALARTTRDARVLRRAQVLLDLDRGYSVAELAERFQVSRSTVYNWIRRYYRWGTATAAFQDRPRSGRPRKSPPAMGDDAADGSPPELSSQGRMF